jgi:hypothetical protein
MNRMRMLAALAAWTAAAATAATITASGNLVTQERPARGIHGVSVAISAQVEVVQGANEGVRITADDNVLPVLQSVVEGGVLKLRWAEDTQIRRANIRVTVTAKSIESIAIRGSAQVRAAAVSTPRLALEISGSGDAQVAGRADSLEVRISGSGDVKAARLAAQRATVAISGSGDATLWAREALRVRVAGSGDVAYYGDPKLEKTIAGSGSVRRLGATPS